MANLNPNLLRNAMLLVSTAVLITGGLATSQYRKATAFGPLFADPYSLAVDQAGNLYCGVEFERVHKYSPEGRMIGAWSVAAKLQPFRIQVAGDASIEVATSAGKLFRFNDVGQTLSSQDDAGAYERFGAANDLRVTTPAGIQYAVAGGAIVRSEKGAVVPWVPAPGWPLRWIRTPVPLTLLLIIGPIGMLASVLKGRSAPRSEPHDATAK